ncbi:UDP-N-acetylglucosamine 1-carboxyvinyltransferase [Emticicia sp. TH156]|uniref:UDP-N-acetylglucosamine 1-carboxyvinyltransferase n=1 Tax=Emticicia sp. TH156 TaxID=2067454 RepID=UPI000C770278|nr:UDP-N-acetylglucosamine 1-carboxyvinyltransferase [Emticicia sp. TH156]PLK43538.1 UDP-N-acetylglucosamine 1-carboxyvinyltransferase [Emticicia sp. TH156]
MASFKITGGKKLQGEIIPQGAKNEALQIVCAVLMTKEPVTIHNIPAIRDVNKLMELLEDMGVRREKVGEGSYRFQADNVNFDYFETPEYKEKASALRGSIMLLGPMLARFGKGKAPRPGGDKIGRRPLDTHFTGFQKLGAEFIYDPNDAFYTVEGGKMKGAYVWMDEISVTGTANVLMAAVMTEGTTTIYNAACEPYLQQLSKMLNSMGAKISGVGSNLLTIEGVKELHGCEHTMLPDMIEIGSFIGLAAMTQSEITIKNCRIPELGIIPDVFRKLGIQMEFRGDDIHIPAQTHYEISSLIDGSILTIYDAPWPGFTPDLISIVLVTAIQAKGTVLIHQKMFESRLFFVDKLIDMGAQIILCDPHRANVIGLNREHQLRGIRMTSPDIRAGVSLLIAAMSAEGTSIIDNIEQIDRGYQFIDKRLNAIGAEIVRI